MARPNLGRRIDQEANLADRIRYERERRGWSYETLAKRMTEAGCKIQGSAIFKIEKGEPRRRITVDELVALANVFDTKVEDMLIPVAILQTERGKELKVKIDQTAKAITRAAVAHGEAMIEFYSLKLDDPEIYDYINFSTFTPRAEDGPMVDVDVDLSAVEKALIRLFGEIMGFAKEFAGVEHGG